MYTDDEALKKKLDNRKHYAEERETKVAGIFDGDPDENVLEGIFNSLTGSYIHSQQLTLIHNMKVPPPPPPPPPCLENPLPPSTT